MIIYNRIFLSKLREWFSGNLFSIIFPSITKKYQIFFYIIFPSIITGKIDIGVFRVIYGIFLGKLILLPLLKNPKFLKRLFYTLESLEKSNVGFSALFAEFFWESYLHSIDKKSQKIIYAVFLSIITGKIKMEVFRLIFLFF